MKLERVVRAAALVAAVLSLFPGATAVSADIAGPASFSDETPARHDARMGWWRDARFGMFIHWGLYSEAAGNWDGKPTPGAGEWIMNDMQIPLSQYAKLVPQFDPEKFNADAWVRLAKDAGMKYICITTKHHDGFAMYPSDLSDWCIKSTPFHRDPLAELAAACKREGIKLCFYYSIMDWHSPLYEPRKPWNDTATNAPDFDAYDAYMKGQLKELLSHYGPIGILWFDGCWESTWTQARGRDLYDYVRSLQPDIIVNNRVGATSAWEEWFNDPTGIGGDYGTPEQAIPPKKFGSKLDWESCMTMNGTWGFKKDDHNWKTATTLVQNLVDCASKGGNYLLNVGPTGEGLIPDVSVERLREVGQWMKVNGRAIYGTTASPFAKPLPWGRCTTKVSGNTTTLYLHVFDWPTDGQLFVPGLKNAPTKSFLLKGGAFGWHKTLRTSNTEDGVLISVPREAPDRISSTIVMEIAGGPQVETVGLRQQDDGTMVLPAADAELHGTVFRYESDSLLDDIGYWVNPADWADWSVKMTKPGRFDVSAMIAAPAASSFDLSVGGQTLHCTGPVTGNYVTFQPVKLGTIEVSAAGKTSVAVHPVKDGWQPMNLRSITLKPSHP
ncbi:MAG TPA: alpha-L-fucosidase [Desulfuromonadaceae bacterium]|nr:alpha-L-fucosidase [Desulfuromonadaceae bacterium]